VNHHFIAVNAARTIGDAPREIQIRHIGNSLNADPAYGKGIAAALKITLSDVPA
jgi:catalase